MRGTRLDTVGDEKLREEHADPDADAMFYIALTRAASEAYENPVLWRKRHKTPHAQ